MRLNKTLSFAVRFSVFVKESGIPAHDSAQLIALAKASVRQFEREDTREHTPSRVRDYHDDISAIAKKYGCTVRWYGLWPSVYRDGNMLHSPSEQK